MPKTRPLSTGAMLLAVTAVVAILVWAPALIGLGAAIAAAVVWSLLLDRASDRGSEEAEHDPSHAPVRARR